MACIHDVCRDHPNTLLFILYVLIFEGQLPQKRRSFIGFIFQTVFNMPPKNCPHGKPPFRFRKTHFGATVSASVCLMAWFLLSSESSIFFFASCLVFFKITHAKKMANTPNKQNVDLEPIKFSTFLSGHFQVFIKKHPIPMLARYTSYFVPKKPQYSCI